MEPVLEKESLKNNPAFQKFLAAKREQLPADKYKAFEQKVTAPLVSNDVCDTISSSLSRVFEAQNSFRKVEFRSAELEAQFNELLEANGVDSFWKTRGFEALKVAPNSILVVDAPREQTTPRPQVYQYLVNISDVVDVDVKGDGACEYVLFKIGKDETGKLDLFAALDDASYRVFSKDENGKYNKEGEDAPHALGYCPAHPFWRELLSSRDSLQRVSPFTKALGRLDEYVDLHASIEFYHSFGMWPVIWNYVGSCDYKDEHSNPCEGGYVNYTNLQGEPCQKKCPKCEQNSLIGPGSRFGVSTPDTKDSFDQMDNGPMGMLKVDIEALKFSQDKLKALEQTIVTRCAGREASSRSEAKNETQVQGEFENKEDVLTNIAWGFEVIQEWAFSTMARLWGGDDFVRVTVSLGDDFYLQTVEEHLQAYELNKKAGMPMHVLAANREMIGSTQYKNDPEQLERSRILANLEPFADLTITELRDFKKDFPYLVSDEAMLLKVNFDYYVKRFEREQLPVHMVASEGVSFNRKIELIQNKLYDYVREQNAKREQRQQLPIPGDGERSDALEANAEVA